MLKDRPDDLLSVMMQTPEPYTPPMLDALQTALPKFTDKSSYPGILSPNAGALVAAEILYRYRRQAGYDYLAQQISHNPEGTDQPSLLAALRFAQRQETAMRDAVLRILLANPKEGELIEALGAWHDPVVANALWTAFQKDPGNSVLALALAQQDAHQAAPLIRHIYFSSLPNRPEKIDAAAALVSLDGDKAGVMLKFLFGTLVPLHGRIGRNRMEVSDAPENLSRRPLP
jgi:hypothetical protein